MSRPWRWEAPELASVAGPRVRFLCLDASPKHLILGANTGSVYVFLRTLARNLPSPFGDEGDAPEGPLRFLTVVSPADAPQRQATPSALSSSSAASARARSSSASPAISRLKLNPAGTLCAIAYTNGVLHVIEFALGRGQNLCVVPTTSSSRFRRASFQIASLTWRALIHHIPDPGTWARAAELAWEGRAFRSIP